ncbi:MAG: sulfatase [Verrucomicrobiales bacterium]|nr:sulfatase [Verrucomicrobiales bacterium]
MFRFLSLLFIVGFSLCSAAERPNIIFLFADDQTFDSLGCYGNQDVKTPHIDKLSKEGLTFDHYYNTTAICMASRANVLTGMYEYKTGCNFGKGDLTPEIFAKSYPVLLRKSGYVTAIAGKIGVEVEGVGLPEDDFDWWGAGPGQTHYETRKNKSMAKYAARYPHSTLSYGAFGSDFINWANEKKSPFCLSISFKAPHRPVSPDPKFDDVYTDTTFRKPANFGRENGLHFSEQSRQGRQYPRFDSWGYRDNFNEALAKYHQLVYAIDQAVGMIRSAVEQAGIADNTVVIYTSDNGYFNGAHGYGSKVLPYEESTRAPMIIHDPREPESHGKRTASLSGNIDVAPTILELASVPIPENVDGKSLLPLLKDETTEIHKHLAIMNCWGPQPAQSFGALSDRYKYIYWYYDNDKMDPAEELYDLENDRLELKNLAADGNSPALKEMRQYYDSYITHIGESAQRKAYKDYATLFDRNQPWENKKVLLPKKLTPVGK